MNNKMHRSEIPPYVLSTEDPWLYLTVSCVCPNSCSAELYYLKKAEPASTRSAEKFIRYSKSPKPRLIFSLDHQRTYFEATYVCTYSTNKVLTGFVCKAVKQGSLLQPESQWTLAVVHGATFVSFFEATQRYKAPDVFTAPSVYWIIAEDQTSFCGYLRRDYIFFLDTVWAYQRSRRQWWLTFRGGSWHHWLYRAEWREVPLSLSGLSSYFHRASHGSTIFLTPTVFLLHYQR